MVVLVGDRLPGGTRTGNVPIASHSALPTTSLPHPLLTASTELPKAPGNPIPGDTAQGRVPTVLSPWGHRASCAGPWGSGSDWGTEQWPYRTSGYPAKAPAPQLARRRAALGHAGSQPRDTPTQGFAQPPVGVRTEWRVLGATGRAVRWQRQWRGGPPPLQDALVPQGLG